MTTNIKTTATTDRLILVIGGTGKTGRRIVEKLRVRGVPSRVGSRTGDPAFDWGDVGTWAPALDGVKAAYISYAPDLAVPGALETVRAFTRQAVRAGVERLVLLSGRGEDEAQACERVIALSGVEWTVVRAAWFMQNFSEGEFLDMIMSGEITLPAGKVAEPFVDVDDIADVAVAALTEDDHDGQTYEVTGPKLMTFHDVARAIATASEREVAYTPIPHAAFVDGLKFMGMPDEMIWLMDYLFKTVLDGRNAYVADGVKRALGREAKDFTAFAKDAATAGVWSTAA